MKMLITLSVTLALTVMVKADEIKECRIVIDTGEKMTEQQRIAIHYCTFADGHLRYSVDGKVVTIWAPHDTYVSDEK